jgi:hypothetical protein
MIKSKITLTASNCNQAAPGNASQGLAPRPAARCDRGCPETLLPAAHAKFLAVRETRGDHSLVAKALGAGIFVRAASALLHSGASHQEFVVALGNQVHPFAAEPIFCPAGS